VTNEATATERDEEVIACLLSEREYAIRGEELAEGLFTAAEEIAELADGYAYRFSGDDDRLQALLEFIAAERRCCPFFTFELIFTPHHGPIWLHLRGSAEIKAFVREQFHPLVAGLPQP